MFYKPKFCSDCGEKVERTDWKPWTSRRFCDLCEADHPLRDWLPRMVFAAGIVSGIFGLGAYLQKAEKPLNIVRTAQAENSAGKTETPALQPLRNDVQPAGPSKPGALNITETKENLPPETQNAADEAVTYCGAATKRGVPCRRPVRGGGRCWQHLGKPLIMPAAKK